MYKTIILISIMLNSVLGFKNFFSYSKIHGIKYFSKLNSKKENMDNIYKPKTQGQNDYLKLINNNNIKLLFAVGPAGTGKTLFACQKAILELKKKNIDKIVITRPIVTLDEDIGFLPGNIINKMDPWTKPIFDIFSEYYSEIKLADLLKNNKIEICPLVFMRGRTFKNSIIIADEMQNSTPKQMKMLTTRTGENSRMIITGDLKQTDILSNNGLDDFISKYNSYEFKKNNLIELKNNIEDNYKDNTKDEIIIHYLSNNDIKRSRVIKKVIDIYKE